MFGGGGGLNPRKMQQMMKQMGIDFDELDAESVTIHLADGEELHFGSAVEVTKMEAQGQLTYQVVGEPEVREAGGGGADTSGGSGDSAGIDDSAGSGADDGEDAEGGGEGSDAGAIPAEDVELVATRTGASEERAREALEAVDGDLAAAAARLE